MNYAIILAAGKGTRMKSDKPKCAYPLLKTPMIEYIMDSLKETNIDKIIAVIGHQKEVFEDLLKDRVTFAYQEEQLGTGHAVLQAKPYVTNLDGHSIILCGDMPLIDADTVNNLLLYHVLSDSEITVVSTIMEDPTSYGRIVRNKIDDVEFIIEEKEASEDIKKIKEINTGLYCVKNKVLFKFLDQVDNNNTKGEYYLTDIIKIAKSLNYKVDVYCDTDSFKFTGINDLYTLSLVEEKLRREINKKHLLNGVCIVNPDTVSISKNVVIEPGGTIYANTYLTGNTVIKEGCKIGPNTEIINSNIGKNSEVIHSVIIDSIIGENTTIGPFAHIRYHSKLGNNLRIGNFVEIKNSNIADKTKIAHLTYIGDTDCGSNVNFGCGCVTANYNGKNKYRTTIGNNVFIGCNSNLIAPINIADNVYIGSGSTLTEDVPTDTLAIARAKQINKIGYAKKYFYKEK